MFFLRFTTNRTRIEINPVRSDFVCCSSLRLFFHQATLNVSNWIKKIHHRNPILKDRLLFNPTNKVLCGSD